MAYDIVVEGHALDALTDWGYVRIGIRDGVIDTISNGVPIEGRRHVVVPEGGIMIPGFFNTHCHMRHPGYTEAEDFEHYQRAAAAGGITTSADQPNNQNCPTITLERMEEKRRLSLEMAPHIDIRFHAGVAFDPELNLEELRRMLELECVADAKDFWSHSTGGMFQPDRKRRYEQQEEFYEFMSRHGNGKPVSNHCENEEDNRRAMRMVRGLPDIKTVCLARYGPGEADEAEKALTLGMKYGVPVVICHGSAASTISVFDDFGYAKSLMEFTPHHRLLSMSDFDGPFRKMYPSLREESDRRAVEARLARGDRVTIGTDHAPHTREKKMVNVWDAPGGIPSDEHLGAFVGHLIRTGMEARTAARVSSYNAAQFFGLKDRGLIEEGMRADLVAIDLDCDGLVRPPYHTKCGWSPYEGMDFGARVTHTIAKGELIFENGEFRF